VEKMLKKIAFTLASHGQASSGINRKFNRFMSSFTNKIQNHDQTELHIVCINVVTRDVGQ